MSSTEPPYDEESYGIVHERHEMNMATSQSQVTQAAQTYLRNAMVVAEVRSLEIPADPNRRRGDIITAHTQSGEFLKGRIKARFLPVSDHKKNMRVDLEVLKW